MGIDRAYWNWPGKNILHLLPLRASLCSYLSAMRKTIFGFGMSVAAYLGVE